MAISFRDKLEDAPVAPQRRCGKCGSPDGPFSPSKTYPNAWCVFCIREYSKKHHEKNGAAKNAAKRAARIADVQALSPDTRTRAQTLRLLRLECPKDKKVCSWCWHKFPKEEFRVCASSGDGIDYYCRGCRTILHRLRRLGLGA